jgi:hypothetical protein
MLKTTAHAQWDLKQTQHVQLITMKRLLYYGFRVHPLKNSPNGSYNYSGKSNFQCTHHLHAEKGTFQLKVGFSGPKRWLLSVHTFC